MKDKLEIGDKVYYKNHWRFSNKYSYIFSEVERLTPTTAVLKNGTKLINESKTDHIDEGKTPRWQKKGDWTEQWELVTDEILKDDIRIRYNNKVTAWVDAQKFTEEEKIKIYELFNPSNK